MPIADAKAALAGQLAQRLLLGYVKGDAAAVDRVNHHLTVANDPELLLFVLSKVLHVSGDIVVALASRVGANPGRAIDDAFLSR